MWHGGVTFRHLQCEYACSEKIFIFALFPKIVFLVVVKFSSMVDDTGKDNAEVLRRRANGEHVDESLMARVRESHAKERKAAAAAKKSAAESLDTNNNSYTGGGASAQANESNDSHTSIKGWNLIKRMHTQFGIHGLDGSRTVDAHVNTELRVCLLVTLMSMVFTYVLLLIMLVFI